MEKVDIIDWKRLLLPYEQAVDELVIKFKGIDTGFRHLEQYSPIEMVTGRVKNVMSIINKAKRKKILLSDVEENIDDIAGVRIVTKFEEDIAKIVLLIRERDGGDLKIIEEKDYVENTKESGYRSYHITIKYRVYTPIGEREVFAEIQVRTLAMNFWATIEHSLRYKYNRNMPAQVKERLIKCAEASYKLDAEMTKIRSEIIEAQRELDLKTGLVNDILKKIGQLQYSIKPERVERLNKQFFDLYNEDNIQKLYAFNKHLSTLENSNRRIEGNLI